MKNVVHAISNMILKDVNVHVISNNLHRLISLL